MESYPTGFTSQHQQFQEQQYNNRVDGSKPVIGQPSPYYGSVNSVIVTGQPQPNFSEVHNGDPIQMVKISPPLCYVLGSLTMRIIFNDFED